MGDQFGHRREVESVDEKGSDASAESGENLLSVTYEKIDFIVLPISIIVGTFLGVLLVISVLLLILRWYWNWGTKYTKLTSTVMDTQTKNSADVNNTESRTPVTAASPSPTSSASSTTSTSSTILLSFPPPLAAVTVTKTVIPTPQPATPTALTVQSPKLTPETTPPPQSPRNDWLHSLQAELQHVQPRRQGSPSENKENTAPNSPLVASANYKHGNYFRFPEVDVWSPGAKVTATPSTQNSPEVVTTPRDTLTVIHGSLISPSDAETARNSPTARRARLKSISLDSESARVVEENLNVAMEELDLDTVQSPSCSKRNKQQLKIDIDCDNLADMEVRQPPTPKTPTLTQTRQKAVSLDSEPPGGVCKSKSQASVSASTTASASVPTTPKRQQQTMSIHQPQRGKSRSTSDHLGSNLQRLKSVTLSVSNNNLKTLPEVMPLSDFGGTPQQPPSQPPAKIRSSLLQRRGSNHSLTLNLAGSVGDLASNTSLTGSMTTNAQNTGGGKKGLLQRRGSNASLTLTIQCSDSGLSRFNSHGSLNAASQSRKGLLSVSNTSLRGSACSLARLKGTSGAGELSVVGSTGTHHRKFLSSENLLQRPTHQTESLELDVDETTGNLEDEDLQGGDECVIRQITTKPLSPQSTSEDFKIYLANIQFLQNASNVLHMDDIREFDFCFEELEDTRADRDECLMKQRRKIRQIHQEFWDLPTNHQEKPMVFGSQHKNRYKTILPNEHSRVILQPEDPEILQEPYINANYIKGPDGTHNAYIATQGPMPNTIYEFWLMVMQNVRRCGEECRSDQKIAMLTEFVESGRTKCAVYFPTEVNQVLVFANGADDVLSAHAPPSNASTDDIQIGGDSMWLKACLDMLGDDEEKNDDRDRCVHKYAFVIENTGVTQKKGYSVRQLCVRHFDHDGKPFMFNVLHYWFPDWPDHRSPEDLGVVLDFALELLGGESSIQETTTNQIPLPVLHCSAGIGRTGCMAGILNAVRQIDSTPINPSVDILGIVCNLRLQRGGMVQNSEQYELIYRVVCLYQKRKDSMTHSPPQQLPFLLCNTLDF
ncbi:pneumococcal serine-rich repeat protein [Phlebotomus papatasi]|uniref:pneumococcal serine-rich repeat protein n=1 Tax=Phlebotomus papatasi TaxID=29031 RepID=UPI0024844F72|nr:pneumococcal serine-rich repeat protein [Phlebotomus papatasi]XP_055712960.1 pneumococcal serine-rich repeat protein [Phlebotomus papatasi]